MDYSWKTLISAIIEVSRRKAWEIKRFRTSWQGCLRICGYPLCREADNWMGLGLSKFMAEGADKDDILDYEVTAPIMFGGSRVAEFEEDDKVITVDTYGVTAMKIADCSRAQDQGIGLLSGLPYEGRQKDDTEKGYGIWRGAVCIEIEKMVDPLNYEPFCGIYVSVSGADEEDDQKVAMAAIEQIKDHFMSQEKVPFKVKIPHV